MGGLILKDLYALKKLCGYYLIVIGIFVVLAYVEYNSVMIAFPSLLAGVIPYTMYAYDEREKFNVYCDVMPVSRKSYVCAKYILGLATVIAASALSIAAALLSPAAEQPFPASLVIFQAMTPGLLAMSVMLPLGFRFGAEKGRLVMVLVFALFFAVSYGMNSTATINLNGLGLTLIIAALLVLSWLLSQRIYEKKEL